MKIEFENGSTIEDIELDGAMVRGNRKKHLECVCYDVETEQWIIGTPLINKNHIPEWVVEEILNS